MKSETIIKVIDWILVIALISVVLYAQIDGRYIHNTYVEICNGIPVNIYNLTLNLTPIK